MATTLNVPWGRLRPGMTVADENGREHKIVIVDHRGVMVSVLFRDMTRELHHEGAYARVRLLRSKTLHSS